MIVKKGKLVRIASEKGGDFYTRDMEVWNGVNLQASGSLPRRTHFERGKLGLVTGEYVPPTNSKLFSPEPDPVLIPSGSVSVPTLTYGGLNITDEDHAPSLDPRWVVYFQGAGKFVVPESEMVVVQKGEE